MVFAVVSGLDTVMKNFLFLIKYFLILGTLTARRTSKQKIKNYQGPSRNWDFLISTNLSPQRVARIVFRAIRRFEHCSKMVLINNTSTPKKFDAPSPCILRCRGTWTGKNSGSLLEQSLIAGHLVVRTHSSSFGYTPNSVEWPFN